jgi:hypothetical protein
LASRRDISARASLLFPEGIAPTLGAGIPADHHRREIPGFKTDHPAAIWIIWVIGDEKMSAPVTVDALVFG